jgi:hypothetical protein
LSPNDHRVPDGTTLATTPEITRRLLGSSANVSQNSGTRDVSVTLDLAGFIRRLLLFDTYILYSVRLKEIPELVKHCGLQGTLDLFASGALEIRCECAQYVEGAIGTPVCPHLTFQFNVVEAHIWEQYLIDCLPALRNAPVGNHELMKLQTSVVNAVKRGDNRRMFASEVAPAFDAELEHNDRLLKSAVRLVLSNRYGIAHVDDFEVNIFKISEDRFRVETNLENKIALQREEIHEVFKRALLGIAGLFQRIGEMKAHVAISGFTEDEERLFRSKFESLADAIGANRNERRFMRVISVAGLGSQLSPDAKIDVDRLLRLRSEPEAIEFRNWLTDVDRIGDTDLKERFSSLNAKLGLAVQTTLGKAIRLLVTNVAGLCLPAGVVLSTLDQFLWDKCFKRSGVAAFINELYPSLFRDGRK